jgi:sugar lactone lactonase YvrE
MKRAGYAVLALFFGLCVGSGNAQTITTLASGFNRPGAVAVDANGTVFVADTANSAIEKITTTNGQVAVTTIGTGTGPLGAVAIDAAGNIYATDFAASRVVELVAATGYSTVATLGSGINEPSGIAVDSAGNVFVTDQGDNTVKEILAAGGYTTVNTLGSGFGFPAGIAVDVNGDVFVADAGNGAVKEILAAGGYATVKTLGSGFNFPAGVAVDGSGNVFVADNAAKTAMEILADGGYTTVKPLAGGFTFPQGVALDAAGNLYLFDEKGAWKLPVAVGYATATKIGSAANGIAGIAADAAGDVLLVEFNQGGIEKLSAASDYAGTSRIATPGFSAPAGIAVDSGGNIFVADTGNNAIKEMTAASGFANVTSIGTGFSTPGGVAVDSQGDVFVADTGNNTVTEILSSGGYASQKSLAAASQTNAIAVDRSGNVFFSDTQGLGELTASGNVETVVHQADFFSGIAIDSSGNLFLSNNDPFAPTGFEVRERMASDGFKTATVVASGFNAPEGLAIDGTGNIFVADTANDAVREILATPPALVASVLPGARSLELGATATVFATMINTSADTLENCQISLPAPAFFTWPSITMSYQTTDPTTNAPTGQPNTPVTIAGGNGQQSFVLSLQSDPSGQAFTAATMPLQFTCGTSAVLETAPIIAGVNSLSLGTSNTPVADVIALAATSTDTGTLTVPQGGVGAFAVASVNVGAAEALTVSVDTGGATLPLTAALCQTDSTSGQCLSPPAATLALTYAANATPTFSVFVQSTGAIAFSPATARIFLRFEDSAGSLHGVTSVAVDTQ